MLQREIPIRIEGKKLLFGDRGDELVLKFHRTEVLSETGGPYPLPPSKGLLPVENVSRYPGVVPQDWVQKGGVFIPLGRGEAFWVGFSNRGRFAKALKFAAGQVNVVSGKQWSDELSSDPQDYLVIGMTSRGVSQPWLDGHNCGNGYVRQFIGTYKGEGVSVEAQVTGVEKHGGMQMVMMKANWQEPPCSRPTWQSMGGGGWGNQAGGGGWGNQAGGGGSGNQAGGGGSGNQAGWGGGGQAGWGGGGQAGWGGGGQQSGEFLAMDGATASFSSDVGLGGVTNVGVPVQEMCLGAGGKMRQTVKRDPCGVRYWNQDEKARLWIHIVEPDDYRGITGKTYVPFRGRQTMGFSFGPTPGGDVAPPGVLSQVQPPSALLQMPTVSQWTPQTTGPVSPDKFVCEAVARGHCTFTVTGTKFTQQKSYHCQTCGLVGQHCFCASCKDRCHAGHNVTEHIGSWNNYCDCGAYRFFKERPHTIPEGPPELLSSLMNLLDKTSVPRCKCMDEW